MHLHGKCYQHFVCGLHTGPADGSFRREKGLTRRMMGLLGFSDLAALAAAQATTCALLSRMLVFCGEVGWLTQAREELCQYRLYVTRNSTRLCSESSETRERDPRQLERQAFTMNDALKPLPCSPTCEHKENLLCPVRSILTESSREGADRTPILLHSYL